MFNFFLLLKQNQNKKNKKKSEKMHLVLLSSIFTFTPTVVWNVVPSHSLKRDMMKCIGKYPSYLESRCQYVVGKVNNYPIAFFSIAKYSADKPTQPIAKDFYANRKVISKLGIQTSMWTDFKAKYKTMPLIPPKYLSVFSEMFWDSLRLRNLRSF